MSDLSLLQRSTPCVPGLLPADLTDEDITHELRFRRLRTAEETRSVHHLRSAIQLPTAARAALADLEKKETSWALWVLSTAAPTL